MTDELWMKNPKRRKEYYERTNKRKSSPFLLKALKLGNFKTALDLGAGAGVDAKEMAKRGIKVTALDVNPEVKKYYQNFPKIDLVVGSFQNFEFGKYDFIYSKSAIIFVPPDDFKNLISKIKESVEPGGVIALRLWGVNDSANKEPFNKKRTFVTKEEIKKIFEDFEIVDIEEIEKDGKTALGKPKHWHIFNVIVRKPIRN